MTPKVLKKARLPPHVTGVMFTPYLIIQKKLIQNTQPFGFHYLAQY